MNHCSKHFCFMFMKYQMLLSGKFRKLASVVKQKTRCALGIAVVDFVGDHLKDKEVPEFHTLD